MGIAIYKRFEDNILGDTNMRWIFIFASIIIISSCGSTKNIIVKREVKVPTDEEIKKYDSSLTQDSLSADYQLIHELILKPELLKYKFKKSVDPKYDWLYKKYFRFVKDSIKTGYTIIVDEINCVKIYEETLHYVRIKSLDNGSGLWFCFFKEKGKNWSLYWVTRRKLPNFPYLFDTDDE